MARSAAVVGAGLAGLTAAYRLQEAGWNVRCFESEAQAGGRVKTERIGGYQFDTGATAVGATYDAYLDLAAELGLAVEPCSPYIGIYRDGRIHHLRLDRMIRSGLTTRLLSVRSKLKLARLARDLIPAVRKGYLDYSDMRKSAPLDTESAQDYIQRRLNDEIDAYLGDPMTRTMLIADSGKASKVEFFSGVANIFSALVSATEGGQGRMTEVLAERVAPELGHAVERVAETDGGVEVDGELYDAAVVACPLPAAVEICPGQAGLLGPLAAELGYTQSITVAVGTTVRPESPAFLVQLSSRDDPDVALMFLDHNKGAGRAPAGHGLLGCCWETDASTRWLEASDADIGEHTLASVYRIFPELEGTADLVHVTRWTHALPWTRIGSYKRIGEFNAALDARSRVQFAGDYMSAAGQHTAVEFGTRAAANLIASR